MTPETCELTSKQKELCAVAVMRTMLEDHAEETGVSFEDAFFSFASTKAYELLFDYDTGLWREGPDHLRAIFEQWRTKPAGPSSNPMP
jgi:hypothetical protein